MPGGRQGKEADPEVVIVLLYRCPAPTWWRIAVTPSPSPWSAVRTAPRSRACGGHR